MTADDLEYFAAMPQPSEPRNPGLALRRNPQCSFSRNLRGFVVEHTGRAYEAAQVSRRLAEEGTR
jgi:hypothetical protein